jgi:hypothetical protein
MYREIDKYSNHIPAEEWPILCVYYNIITHENVS